MPGRLWRAIALPAVLLLTTLGIAALAGPASADQPGCRVTYAVQAEFNGGFFVGITIANDGPATNGWQIDFTFPSAGQHLSSAFSARWTQTGATVRAISFPWNARIATGSSTQIGFTGTDTGPDPVPTDIRINGCGDHPFPPTPLVTAPFDGQTMLGGQVIVLRADTLGFPGTVTRIDFAANGTLLGSSTDSPWFNFTWFPLPVGTFSITATGFDDRGTVATSAPMKLIVRPNS